MAKTYIIDKVEITESPQTIYYATLTDIKDTSLPASFFSVPVIGITGAHQDRGAYIVSKDRDHFVVSLKIFGRRDCDNYYFNFLIRGES